MLPACCSLLSVGLHARGVRTASRYSPKIELLFVKAFQRNFKRRRDQSVNRIAQELTHRGIAIDRTLK
jgi:hypothetical protein